MAGGRPTIYSEELANEICLAIASSSKGLVPLCKANPHWPDHSTIRQWILDKKEFSDKYDFAKQEQADFLADEILEISDHVEEDHTAFTGGNVVQRDRLRIDARKWVASKLKPKKYGDKLDLSGETTQTIVVKYSDGEKE